VTFVNSILKGTKTQKRFTAEGAEGAEREKKAERMLE